MDAQREVNSLLGWLTSILVNEAQLLGGIRSDVEFIKDEMESMNGLLMHLTEAQHRDHQVKAWMKQVASLTRDCRNNAELCVHYIGAGNRGKGILGYLLRIPRFLGIIPVWHKIAIRIRELKVRAQDIGERRLRYGVSLPESGSSNGTDMHVDHDVQSRWSSLRQYHHWRRTLIDVVADPPQWDARLLHKPYIESVLTFNDEEFFSLNFLLVQGNDITNISFVNGAAPKLERIILSVTSMKAISGIDALPCLRKLETGAQRQLQ
ncbi:hypothetical protein PR202_gb13632 [Eleusine coracana subsp. coracana]|uniref:Disease resistance N-terminal domain-containing protein n=1 Tax=Eleusine coracana subsp. coracana TaxID=191504 RepID=A0AAV5ET38_ELECO|nr:hypothetical protein PR202_gb13632 [Eleusine coracana subsp. coracana]